MNNKTKRPDIESAKEQIIQMVADGESPQRIADAIGASRSGVARALERWGETCVDSSAFAKFMLDREDVIKARLNGATRVEIVNRWKINSCTATKYLSLWGHPFDQVPIVDWDEIVELREGGLLFKEIAEKTGASLSTVGRVIQLNGMRVKTRTQKQKEAPKVEMPAFDEGQTYTIDREQYVFQRMLKAQRPMALFTDKTGNITTFTDAQLVGVRRQENETAERGA